MRWWRLIGPGIVVAATGVGAGDLIAAGASGARFGYAVVWAAVVGAALKFVVNEGLARWQLATGTTLLEGWAERHGKGVHVYFLAYLVVWSFLVGGALISACGLAAHALVPSVPVPVWGMLHSVVAAGLVSLGGYRRFESVMKVFIGVMFVTLVGCALLVESPVTTLGKSIARASVPVGGAPFILGVIGGVGGSVTLLTYGYWIRERGWEGRAFRSTMRVDLAVAYGLTGVFGVAVTVLAASVLHDASIEVRGNEGALRMADMVGVVLGPWAGWVFRVGFWGAVATSLLGVWQGVPYLFSDFVALIRKLPAERRTELVSPRSPWYRAYLAFLAIPPMSLLFLERPVAIVIAYAIAGALFMPFLAGSLLYMNSRRDWVGADRNGWAAAVFLALSVGLFGYLGYVQIVEQLTGW